MKILYEFVARNIAGEDFLVPIGEAAKRYSGLFALNELGAFLWKHLPDARDENELVELILNEYDVDRETAAADTAEFLQELRKMNILE